MDVRKFYKKENQYLPSNKGISLSVDSWNELKKLIPQVDEALNKIK